jgi:hypothetical protein
VPSIRATDQRPHLKPLGFSGEGGRGFHHGSKQIHRFNKKPYTLPQTASAIEDLLAIRRRTSTDHNIYPVKPITWINSFRRILLVLAT